MLKSALCGNSLRITLGSFGLAVVTKGNETHRDIHLQRVESSTKEAAVMFCVMRKIFTVAALTLLLFWPPAYSAEAPWKSDWDRTVKAAEAEGSVVIYTSSSLEPTFTEAFQRKFPRIKVTTVSGRGFQLGQRVLSERRSGKFIPDVFVQGATTPSTALYPAKALASIRKQLVLPDILDQSNWWQGRHHYVDPEGEYIFMFEGAPSNGNLIYNTNLVKPDELKSYWDLIDAKWKSKIVIMDPTTAGPASQTMLFFYFSAELGPQYLKRLSEANPTIIQDDVRLIDWVATGKFALGFFPRGTDITKAEKSGLPVKQFPTVHFKEGAFVSTTGFTISLLEQAPHPNAAKVLINWFLSREGQSVWLENVAKEAFDYDSLREDVPKDKIPIDSKRIPGFKYFVITKHQILTDKKPAELVKQLLTPSQKQ
jgi:iron(III) transport system substrate-binding protein